MLCKAVTDNRGENQNYNKKQELHIKKEEKTRLIGEKNRTKK